MKRTLGLLVLFAALAAPALVPVTATAEEGALGKSAPAPVTGRVWDYVNGAAQAGVRIELKAGPGEATLGTAVTGSDGRFSVVRDESIPIGGPFLVKVVSNGRIQSGLVGTSGGKSWVQPSVEYADYYTDGTNLGTVRATPAYIRGQVVNSRTGRPVHNVLVAALRAGDNSIAAMDHTNSNGVFMVRPLRGEDFNLRVNGSAVGYEKGYRACNAEVVRTIGQACGSPLGVIGRIRLDRR